MIEPDEQLALEDLFDPERPAPALSPERIVARRLMTYGELWRIAKYERRLGRCLSPQEELAALAEERELERQLSLADAKLVII